MPDRPILWFHPESDSYFAGDESEDGPEISNVTGILEHEAAARLQGEWTGKGVLPRDLCKKGTEHGEQAAWFAWVAANVGTMPDLAKAFAIPNGGLRDAKTASMMKAEGVRSGIPDVLLPKPVIAHVHHVGMFGDAMPLGAANAMVYTGRNEFFFFAGLWLEFKRKKKGKLSSEQVDRIDQLRADGYAAIRVNGWIEARDAAICYLKS